MKTKICTSIEQSKKLLELGLDADTADMGYNGIENRDTGRIWYDKYPTTMPNVDSIPAWSLSALLELIPDEIKFEGTNCSLELAKDWISYGGCDAYDASYRIQPMAFNKEPLIDLAYKTVCWLIEQGYIKTEKK